MASTFGAMLVEKLRRIIPGSLAAMTGLVNTDAQNGQGSLGNAGADATSATELTPSEVRDQYKATMLATHGIKVRDYAYESKLPPVPSYHPPRPKGPRPLKRTRQEYEVESSDEEGDFDTVVLPSVLDDFRSHERRLEARPSKKAKPLERAVTEPIEESQTQPPMGYSDLAQITEADAALSNSQQGWMHSDPPSTPPAILARLLRSPLNPIQSSGSYSEAPVSQTLREDSEPWIDTPVVTPRGSLQFITDNTTRHPPQLDGPSFTRTSVSRSSANHTSQHPQIAHPLVRRGLSQTMSRILTPPRLSRSPSLRQLQIAKSHSRMNMTPRRLSTGSITSPSPPPRYYLRDRSIMKSPTRPTLRQRMSSQSSTSSPSPRRTSGKARSSFSKSAVRNTGKVTASPVSKPVLRRSARRAGVRL